MSTTLGDCIQWLINTGYWVRGIESIIRLETGWSFVHTTQVGFVSDEVLSMAIPEKTEEEWKAWGR
jgi:hypothetical protein